MPTPTNKNYAPTPPPKGRDLWASGNDGCDWLGGSTARAVVSHPPHLPYLDNVAARAVDYVWQDPSKSNQGARGYALDLAAPVSALSNEALISPVQNITPKINNVYIRSTMAFRSNDRDARSRQQNDYNDRLLEFQNDDAMDSLHGKISALKNVGMRGAVGGHHIALSRTRGGGGREWAALTTFFYFGVGQITIEMHDDVNSQNQLLSNMGTTFDSASDKMRGSFRKMTTMMGTQHGRHTCTIVGLSLLLFIVIWFLATRASPAATP
ncbi:hypothetical protein DFJ77DRAFT_516108 [Powellomyces hirtus]|nr:hypothetical protein DFJ77DRAFT_516108 [Powellomyces hirtus]